MQKMSFATYFERLKTEPNESMAAIESKHRELCSDLNMDSETIESSWRSYKKTSEENTLEVRGFL